MTQVNGSVSYSRFQQVELLKTESAPHGEHGRDPMCDQDIARKAPPASLHALRAKLDSNVSVVWMKPPPNEAP